MVSVSSQTEIEFVSKEEHEKMMKEYEKLKEEHHELLLKCARYYTLPQDRKQLN